MISRRRHHSLRSAKRNQIGLNGSITSLHITISTAKASIHRQPRVHQTTASNAPAPVRHNSYPPMASHQRQSDYGIHEVWADNLEAEFAALRAAVDQYPFISMVRAPVTAVS